MLTLPAMHILFASKDALRLHLDSLVEKFRRESDTADTTDWGLLVSTNWMLLRLALSTTTASIALMFSILEMSKDLVVLMSVGVWV